ncbi:hypothetical protein [Salmon gill poxvirus]|nr:hypothetical protein [Salmon gill poxvirus]
MSSFHRSLIQLNNRGHYFSTQFTHGLELTDLCLGGCYCLELFCHVFYRGPWSTYTTPSQTSLTLAVLIIFMITLVLLLKETSHTLFGFGTFMSGFSNPLFFCQTIWILPVLSLSQIFFRLLLLELLQTLLHCRCQCPHRVTCSCSHFFGFVHSSYSSTCNT